MPGFNDNDSSLANGIPARHISPETGSSGDATMTNRGGTSEGTNEAFDSDPSPASGLDRPVSNPGGVKEKRTFSSRSDVHKGEALDSDEEAPAQQIADGGDRIKHEHSDKADR